MMTIPAMKIHLPPRPPQYQSSRFVDRENEVGMIEEKILLARYKRSVTEPIVNFWGVGGIGKTWILRHLHNRYTYSPHVTAHLPSAENVERAIFSLHYTFPDNPAPVWLDFIASNLADQILSQLSSVLPAEKVAQLIQAKKQKNGLEIVVRVVLPLSRRLVPLLLLDNTEWLSESSWQKIERSLIEPLARSGRAVIVIAGRRQVPRWRRFEVRRRLMDPEKSHVRPFSLEFVNRQLAHYARSFAYDILFRYTAGIPYLVDAFGQFIEKSHKGKDVEINQSWFHQHRDPLLEFVRAAEEKLLARIQDNSLRQALNAVSPLRFYRLEALRAMLTWQEPEDKRPPDAYYLNLLRGLDQKTEVVWWDRSHRAYVTSKPIRQLMNHRQLLENSVIFGLKHRNALTMYWGWAREFPKICEDFILEIWFHQANLHLANKNSNLKEESQKALDFACKHLSPDRLMILQKGLEQDQELHDLISSEVYAELSFKVQQTINKKTSV